MRIAHVIDYFHTDVGYQEYYLAREQASAGHDVTVVTTTHRHHTVAVAGPDQTEGDLGLARAGVNVVRLDALQLGHDRAWIRGFEPVLIEARPDVTHCHGPFAPTTLRCVRACAGSGVPVLVDNHIQAAIAPGSASSVGRAFYRIWRLAAAPFLRRHVGTWVANGPAEADFMREHLGLGADEGEAVPLGFDPGVFSYDDSVRFEARRRRGWGANDLVVAVTGKIHTRKRPEETAMACERRWKAGEPVRLALAGTIEPDAAANIHHAAPELHAAGRVHDVGNLGRRELSSLYQAADIVVFARLPSISVYEAAGTGARVVVGDREFGQWLSTLHPEIVHRRQLDPSVGPVPDRADAARRARAAFSWEHVSERFVHLYQELTSRA